MIDHNVQRPVPREVIPRGQLIIIALAMLSLIGIMAFIAFNSLPQGSVAKPASNVVSSRLASAPEQVNVGGNVTVRVIWPGPEAGLTFSVVMDTHSVDLDSYDLSRMVVLHTNDGRESAVLKWDAPKGGHHRRGTLTFSEVALDGKPLIGADTKFIELVIYDLSGVAARSFTWQLK
jgi:hypothetical protein